MKVFGICLIKNEENIIEYLLDESSKWAHKIFVYDNGSEDRTWEIVQEVAKRNDRIVPYKSEALPFRDGLRAKVFNEYRHLAEDGDWWCFRLDSDEFYIDDPREFLPTVPKPYNLVIKRSYDYQLTHEDVEEFTFTNTSPHDILQLKYYKEMLHHEMRFFRYRKSMRWPESVGKPLNLGLVYEKEKIGVKHFQYRSPDQIQERLMKKKIATAQGYQFFKNHDYQDDWKELLVHRSELVKETPAFEYKGFLKPDKYKQSLKRKLFYKFQHYTGTVGLVDSFQSKK